MSTKAIGKIRPENKGEKEKWGEGPLGEIRLKVTPQGETRREAKRDRLTEALAESTEAEAGILFKAASAEFIRKIRHQLVDKARKSSDKEEVLEIVKLLRGLQGAITAVLIIDENDPDAYWGVRNHTAS
jgi:hypothetical protein